MAVNSSNHHYRCLFFVYDLNINNNFNVQSITHPPTYGTYPMVGYNWTGTTWAPLLGWILNVSRKIYGFILRPIIAFVRGRPLLRRRIIL